MSFGIPLFLKCVSISTALAIGSSACFSTPGKIQEVNDSVLAIQLEQAAVAAAMKSNLLTEGGQTILLDGNFSEKTIPMTVSCSDPRLTNGTAMTAMIKAVSNHSDRLTVSLDKQEIILDGTEQTVNLVLQRPGYVVTENEEQPEEQVEEEPAVKEEITEEEKTEESEGNNIETDGNDSEDEPLYQLPSIEEIENKKENDVNQGIFQRPIILTGSGIFNDKTVLEKLEPEQVPGEGEVPPETEQIPGTEDIPTEPEETPDEEEPEDDVDHVEDKTLKVEVRLLIGEIEFAATFVIDETVVPETAAGELKSFPSQYHPESVVQLTNNEETETVVDHLPPMTKYSMNEMQYILYDGGKVIIPAGMMLQIDLSQTQWEEDLILTSMNGTEYVMKYAQIPHESDNTQVFIVDGTEKILPVSYQWGDITPVITVEHLVVGKDGLKWNNAEAITYQENSEGKIQIFSNGSKAGTYRIKVLWNENEMTLYQFELPFYIQSGSGNQGGIGK